MGMKQMGADAMLIRASVPTLLASLHVLQKQGIARELTGQRRGRLFSYDQYIKILSEGTEPL
jgi:hypothetical protein